MRFEQWNKFVQIILLQSGKKTNNLIFANNFYNLDNCVYSGWLAWYIGLLKNTSLLSKMLKQRFQIPKLENKFFVCSYFISSTQQY